MEAIIQSFLLVAVSEMGDKTQLLALVLALRYKRPWTIMAGILVATLLNHGLASWVGGYVSSLVSPEVLRYTLAAIFGAFALWILVPDKDEDGPTDDRFGPFLTTLVTFFLAEMGDKTQLATVALGARYASTALVTAGTTLGMLAADGLADFTAVKLDRVVPIRWVRLVAAGLFFLFGLGALAGAAGLF